MKEMTFGKIKEFAEYFGDDSQTIKINIDGVLYPIVGIQVDLGKDENNKVVNKTVYFI